MSRWKVYRQPRGVWVALDHVTETRWFFASASEAWQWLDDVYRMRRYPVLAE